MVSYGFVVELGSEVDDRAYAIRQLRQAMCFYGVCGQKARDMFPKREDAQEIDQGVGLATGITKRGRVMACGHEPWPKPSVDAGEEPKTVMRMVS